MKLLLACALALRVMAPPAQAQGLPSGFEEVAVVSGLSLPTAIAFAPDGRLFICEKGGAARVFKAGVLLPTPFIQLSVSAQSERGLLGIALDPDFPSEPYVYLYYTTSAGSRNPPPSPKNRVSRFTVSGDTAGAASEQILVDLIPSDAGNHNAGCLRFGPDGKLYIATGDGGAVPSNSQDLGNLAGKILRINKDGSIPSDNPFFGQAGKRGEIYCYGLRNPFRFAFRPGTNTPYIADVGQNTWEEVNVGQPGGNYGWPTYEGPTTAAGAISPIYSYPHNGSGASITGGCFVTNPNWPAGYRDAYYFGDYVDNFLGRLVVNPDNTLAHSANFGSGAGPVDFAQGPEGDLYYASITTGSIRKIRYVAAANRPPVAQASASTTAGPLPLTVNFSSAGSSDPDGDPLSFLWNFGDNTTSTEPNPTRVYSQAGAYSVTLQVSDGRGGVTNAAPLSIRAGNSAPTVVITAPGDESLYNAGDTVEFRGVAHDAEDGPLPATHFRWKVIFYHDDHTHPGWEFAGVSTGSFTIPRSGEPSVNTWYELRLTVPDSTGTESTAVVQIRPRKVQLTFTTWPKPFPITLNGQPRQTPVTLWSVVGFDHVVEAPDQERGDEFWWWWSWSDGGEQEHLLRAPASDTSYTALYRR